MQAVTGVFSFRADAERAVGNLRSTGVPANKITLLIPENVKKELESVPVDAAEQPGMGKAVGAVVGAAAGLSGGHSGWAAGCDGERDTRVTPGVLRLKRAFPGTDQDAISFTTHPDGD